MQIVFLFTFYTYGLGAILANDTSNQTFCVEKDDVDPKMIHAALDWTVDPEKLNAPLIVVALDVDPTVKQALHILHEKNP
ncbi:glucan endo-1,3-beta-glucosidase 3-like [Vicia villosa]|uniref:glucan endo-1,3-beta-glucosidase 3-like n=1 Tax=Vicia villosa TaxID=3911 RepID=UPI00273A8EC3|nr:glucan endo-1,3-beta-glucosidase 3-like [Vicia villosa]